MILGELINYFFWELLICVLLVLWKGRIRGDYFFCTINEMLYSQLIRVIYTVFFYLIVMKLIIYIFTYMNIKHEHITVGKVVCCVYTHVTVFIL